MAEIKIARRGQAAVLAYSNPPRSTMTAAGSVLLTQEFDKALADPAVRAIILTGADEGVFVRHYDVGEIVGAGERLQSAGASAGPSDGGPFARLIDAVAAAPKPVIAAINGLCMGGGFELSLACDIRIAGRKVEQIGLPEVRVGIFPGGGGTQRLPRLIGEGAALAFILQGSVVGAEEALRLGLVHALADDPIGEAVGWAERLAAFPAGGLAAAKRLVRASLDRPLAEGLADERRSFGALIRDDQEAIAAMRRTLAPGAAITDA
jgi:enoyl-CoA hydratase/carnithine racemase